MTADDNTVLIESLLDEVMSTVPLFFIQEFLRTARSRSNRVRIGANRREVRTNLRDALTNQLIGRSDLDSWLHEVGGWGRQHLQLLNTGRSLVAHPSLRTSDTLRSALRKRGLYEDPDPSAEPTSAHLLSQVACDDSVARLVWRSHGSRWERHEELDETRELVDGVWRSDGVAGERQSDLAARLDIADGLYQFRAYRHETIVSSSRAIIRKRDGLILLLIDLPLGEEHDALRQRMLEAVEAILLSIRGTVVTLSPVIVAFDKRAVPQSARQQGRPVGFTVAPRQAKYRAEGGSVEFASTRASASYTDSDPVRELRDALVVRNFEGEAGKFRLQFTGVSRRRHDMVVSMNGYENRVYLFSTMDETEVVELADRILGAS